MAQIATHCYSPLEANLGQYDLFGNHESHSSNQEELPEPLAVKASKVDGVVCQNYQDVARWRPFWLRRIALTAFTVVFLCCTIALSALLHISHQNEGLGEMRKSLAQLWRFGPTAVITLLGIFWHRVELQVLRYTPWGVAVKNQSLERDLYMLDYTSMFPPVVLVQSLRKKHFLVFIATFCSILTQILVVLSANLFELRNSSSYTEPIEIQVMDSLPNAFSVRKDSDSIIIKTAPFYYAEAQRDFGLDYPFGVVKEGAYQTFRKTGSGLRGTIESPVTAIVDGLFTEANCVQLHEYQKSNVTEENEEGDSSPLLDLHFEECNGAQLRLNAAAEVVNTLTLGNFSNRWTIRDVTEDIDCSSLPKQLPRYLYAGQIWSKAQSNTTKAQLESVAAVICSIGFQSSKVKVTDNGHNPSLEIIPGQNSTLLDIDLWSMLSEFSSSWGAWDKTGQGPVLADSQLRGLDFTFLNNVFLYKSDVLQQIVYNQTEIIGPYIAHYNLREYNTNRNDTAFGTITTQTPKLFINSGVCITMAVLFGISTIISSWIALKSREIFDCWLRDPATILGSVIFFSGHKNRSRRPQRGSILLSKGKELWKHPNTALLPLKAWLRAVFCTFVLGLVICLIVTARISDTSGGLLTIPHSSSSIWWKLIPALLMFLVTLYTSSSDTTVRGLGSLYSLSLRPNNLKILDCSFVDMLGIQALYHSIRLKIYPVTLTQTLAILCGFLTTLSTLLFTQEPYAQIIPETFQITDSFTTYHTNNSQTRFSKLYDTVETLVMAERISNVTWLRDTYEDLLLPHMALPEHAQKQARESGTPVELTLKAIKAIPTCRRVPIDEYSARFITRVTNPNDTILSVTRQQKCTNGTFIPLEIYKQWVNDTTTTETQYTAFRFEADGDPDGDYMCDRTAKYNFIPRPAWKMKHFFWGSFATNTPQPKLITQAYWKCNYSFAEVPTKVSYVLSNGDLEIDYNKPPIPDLSNTRPWSYPISIPHGQDPLPRTQYGKDSDNPFDVAFRLLLEPLGELKKGDLGKPSEEEHILEALHKLNGIGLAQLASVIIRSNNSTPDRGSALVNGSIIDNSRSRLVQSQAITYTLISILTLTLSVNLWALISSRMTEFLGKRGLSLDMEFKNLAPDGYESIFMRESLLDGSNLLSSNLKEAYYLPLREFFQVFSWVRVRSGWFIGEEPEKRTFTVGVLDDEGFPFVQGK